MTLNFGNFHWFWGSMVIDASMTCDITDEPRQSNFRNYFESSKLGFVYQWFLANMTSMPNSTTQKQLHKWQLQLITDVMLRTSPRLLKPNIYRSFIRLCLLFPCISYFSISQPSVDVQLHLPACMSWRRSDEEKNPREARGREFYS